MKILIDRNVEIRAVTHVTEIVPQTITWGPHRLTVAMAKRLHRPPREDETFVVEQLPFLAALCETAKTGVVLFYTSFELVMEASRQRGRSAGYMGVDMLRDAPMQSVRPPVARSLFIASRGSVGLSEEEQMDFFRSIQDPRFRQIREAVGEAHIDDAFHLWTAEVGGLDALLTMDKRFLRVTEQRAKDVGSPVVVASPSQLCQRLELEPVK